MDMFVEFGGGDTEGVGPFFAGLFGWTFHPMDGRPGNGWFETEGGRRHGLHAGDPQPQTYVYFGVPDIDAAIAKVKALGGTADKRGEAGEFGSFADCKAPGGLPFGLHQR